MFKQTMFLLPCFDAPMMHRACMRKYVVKVGRYIEVFCRRIDCVGGKNSNGSF